MAITQGFVLRDIGFNLGSIKANLSQFQDSHLLGNSKDLHEHSIQLREKSFSELGYRVMVRMSISSYKAKGHRIVGAKLQLSA